MIFFFRTTFSSFSSFVLHYLYLDRPQFCFWSSNTFVLFIDLKWQENHSGVCGLEMSVSTNSLVSRGIEQLEGAAALFAWLIE